MDFLRKSKPRRANSGPEPVAFQAAAPVEPQPILVPAVFQTEHVAPRCVNHGPKGSARPVPMVWRTILPALSGLPAPFPRTFGCSRVVLRLMAIPAHPKRPLMTAAGFRFERPCLCAWVARPLWVEAAKETPEQRPLAPFAHFRPAWRRAGCRHASAPAALRFSSAPTLPSLAVVPVAVRLRLVAIARPVMTAAMRSASGQECSAHCWEARPGPAILPKTGIAPHAPRVTSGAPLAVAKPLARQPAGAKSTARIPAWRVPGGVLHKPAVALAPRVLGLPVSHAMPAVLPRARKFAAPAASGLQRSWRQLAGVLRRPVGVLTPCAPGLTPTSWTPSAMPRPSGWIAMVAARTRHPLPASSLEAPRIRSWHFEFAPPALRSRSHVRAKTPQPRPVPLPVVNGGRALIWKFPARLGPYARVIPIRPRFEDPLLLEPRPRLEPAPPASLWKKIAVRWCAMPLWCRRAATVLAPTALVWSGFGYLESSGSLRKANRELMARIHFFACHRR